MEGISRTPYHSLLCGKLAKGCGLCVQGKKMVVFVTGRCAQRCFYCPVSEHKFGKDDAYANEWKIADPTNPVELLEEARLTNATGAGITGGDPLANIKRTCEYIKLLKSRFGKKFHIHLYTPLRLVTREHLDALYTSGLDEIRVHPDLDDQSLWNRIDLARAYDWDIGIEIPAIPGYEAKTRALVDATHTKISFLNLNELELSDTTTPHYQLESLGFLPKNDISYGVAGSETLAHNIMEYARTKKLATHFCTARLKDGVQVKKRLIARATNTKGAFGEATGEGTLLFGCCYLSELSPSAGYRKKLACAGKDIDKKLMIAHKTLLTKKIQNEVDARKKRILLPLPLLRSHIQTLKDMTLVPAIVEEHPTADGFEVEIEFL
ncbi:radical SAM protein [Candidatus Woesearchaeota archaeon]|nr:radical SAM protein [Candidatus Woesearchaeota archaeon]